MTTRGAEPGLRPAVILAQGTGSLGAARVLGRRGVPVIAVLWDPVTPIRHSRYARRIVEVPPGTAAEREAYLLRLLTSLGEDRPVLLASSDRLIEFIARHRAELAPHFALCAPSFALIEVLNDKAREVELIASLGFSVPKTLAPVPPSADEIEARLGLPVIIKPRSFQHLSLIAGKNVVIRDRAASNSFCRRNNHAGQPEPGQNDRQQGNPMRRSGAGPFRRRRHEQPRGGEAAGRDHEPLHSLAAFGGGQNQHPFPFSTAQPLEPLRFGVQHSPPE